MACFIDFDTLFFIPRRVETAPGLSGHQNVHPFEIESQTYQTPFARRGSQTTQRELAKSQDFFDDADDWLHGTFAQSVDGLADLGLQFVGHFDLGPGLFSGRLGVFLEESAPSAMMGFAPGGTGRLNPPLRTGSDVGFAKEAIVEGSRLGLAHFRGRASRVATSSWLALGWLESA